MSVSYTSNSMVTPVQKRSGVSKDCLINCQPEVPNMSERRHIEHTSCLMHTIITSFGIGDLVYGFLLGERIFVFLVSREIGVHSQASICVVVAFFPGPQSRALFTSVVWREGKLAERKGHRLSQRRVKGTFGAEMY